MLPGFSGDLLSERFLATTPAGGDERHREAGRRLLAWRERCQTLGPASGLRAILDVGAGPLAEALGFDAPCAIGESERAVAATLATATHRVALLVVGWCEPLESWWTSAVAQAFDRSSPWCVLFNGCQLRVVDGARVYARRHFEWDLDAAFEDDRALAAFLRLTRASMLAGGGVPPRTALHDLVDASDRHASGVCRSLRHGVLQAASDVATSLAVRGRRAVDGSALDRAYEQSLTIVYRLLFLLFAEARGLMPLWHPVYRNSYSVEALRAMAERPRAATGFWDALQAMSRLAHAGCRAGDLRVTPFNGRLFAPSHTPLAERRDLDDEAARRTVLALSTRPAANRAARERIGYHDLGVEQLGAVYETILDYRPKIEGRRVALEAGSGLRKASGTFYTPQPIADYIVRRTLEPLVRHAAPERILGLRVLDPAMGSGAFLVAACRYLAREYERALVDAGGCLPADIGDAERATIRRTIAERCLYGVDINPMAVQLARLSLWLTTLAADRPLTFLDHRLRTGDSLVGAWLSALGRPPRPGRERRQGGPDPPRLFDEAAARPAIEATLPLRFALENVPGDTIERVREKERTLATLHRRQHVWERWRRVADLWCAAWFSTSETPVPPEAFGALTDAVLAARGALPDGTAAAYLGHADAIATRRRFLHWEIEFPEVFFSPAGTRLPAPGFDAVLGNPPWDMVRGDAGSPEDRRRARLDGGPLVRFARSSGVYTATTTGHPNRYQLFAERALDLTRPGGRLGLVLPSGVAIDHGSAALRQKLFARASIDAIAGFDNRDGVFPIHRSVRFMLVTASAGSPTHAIACRLGERDPAVLERLGDGASRSPDFPVQLSMELLGRLSGDTFAIPDLRSAMDVSLAERAAALFPPLGSRHGWGARFGRELNATDDRRHFVPSGSGLPIVEGKHIGPFAVDLQRTRQAISPSTAGRLLRARPFERVRLAYRDVAGATNRLTLIAALLPAGCVTTHTVFCLRTPMPVQRQHALCALLNSFVVNYFVRQRVTTHVTTAVVQALPAPTPATEPRALGRIAGLARLLARGPQRAAYCQLQAAVAGLYRLSAPEFEHVLGTFPLVEREIRDEALRVFATEAQRPGR